MEKSIQIETDLDKYIILKSKEDEMKLYAVKMEHRPILEMHVAKYGTSDQVPDYEMIEAHEMGKVRDVSLNTVAYDIISEEVLTLQANTLTSTFIKMVPRT